MESNFKLKPPLYSGIKPRLEVLILIALVGVVSFFLLSRQTQIVQGGSSNDCEYAKVWSDWGRCTTDCGAEGWQYATRSIVQYPFANGAACDPALLLKSQTCESSLTCGQNCIPGNIDDAAWTPCPKCIYATEIPTQWRVIPPLQQATGNGQDCNVDQVFQSRLCTANIPQCPPDVDCVLGLQSQSLCSLGPCEKTGQTGFKTSIFTVSTQSSGRGRQCDFATLVRVEECNTGGGSCDCAGTVWGAYSECNASCGPGVQVRIAQTPNPNCPVIDFKACEYTPCENGTCVPPPIDLVLAECYLQCAGLPTSSFAAGMCSTSSILDAVCAGSAVKGNCLPPQPCSLSTWSDWGACPTPCLPENPLGSTQTRLRYIVEPSRGGGQSCIDPNLVLTATQPCNNYVPVTYSAYDITIDNYVRSVTQGSCPAPGPCLFSEFKPVTPCENRYMCLSVTYPVQADLAEGTISYARTITNFTPECYAVDYTQLFTTSKCGWGVPEPTSISLTLPSCTVCKWAQTVLSTDQQAAMCSSFGTARYTGFFTNPLVTESNVLGDFCANHPNPCDYLTPDTTTCSVLTRTCYDDTMCPHDDSTPPRLCSGNGFAQYFSGPDPTTPLCSCSCYPPFSGKSCSTASQQCPIASVTNLVCNGFGECVAGTCRCFDANDTTADCTAEKWCWVYINVQSSLYSNYQKLLGAYPMLGQIDETKCASLNRNIRSAMPSVFTVRQPRVVDYRVGAGSFQDQAFTLFDASLEARVNYFAPPNLQTSLMLPCINPPTSLSAVDLMYNVTGGGNVGINSFKPIVVPNSVPATCESPLIFTAFAPTAQPLVQAVPRPLLSSNTVNYNPTTTTFTQIRYITLSAPVHTREIRRDLQNNSYIFTSYVFPDNLTITRAFYPTGFSPGPTYYGFNAQLTAYEFFQMDMQGSIVKDWGAPNFFVNGGSIVYPPQITVKFPWLPNQTVDPQFVDPQMPNGADFIAINSKGGLPPRDACFKLNGDVENNPQCYNRRANLSFDRMPAPFLTNSNDLHNIRFQTERYSPMGPVRGSGALVTPFGDYTLDHPFCTVGDQYTVTKELGITTWFSGQAVDMGFDAGGTIFSCQILRYFASRGEGTVMPVTISFVS